MDSLVTTSNIGEHPAAIAVSREGHYFEAGLGELVYDGRIFLARQLNEVQWGSPSNLIYHLSLPASMKGKSRGSIEGARLIEGVLGCWRIHPLRAAVFC